MGSAGTRVEKGWKARQLESRFSCRVFVVNFIYQRPGESEQLIQLHFNTTVTMALASGCLVLLALAGFSWGCKPDKEENTTYEMDWKVMKSDTVAHGVVISTDPDPIPAKGVYSVLFEVMCSYKGGPLPEMIRINKVGYNPDICLNTSLTVDSKFLVYLKHDGNGEFEQRFRQESGESQSLEEIVVLCDVEIQYPIGKNSTTAKEVCPEKYDFEDCVERPTILANPPYSNGDKEHHSHGSSAETVKKQTKEKPAEGKDIPKEFPASVVEDDDRDSSVTLTLNMGAMILPFLAIILSL